MRILTIKALMLFPVLTLIAFSASAAQEEIRRDEQPKAAGREENVSRKITDEFRSDPLFDGMNLTIDLYKGLAIVHGGAANSQMVAMVTRRLQEHPGVEVVYNYMSSPDTPLAQPESVAVTYDYFDRMRSTGKLGSSFAIAGAVRDRLEADPRLTGIDFDIDSYQGLIILHGDTATAAQSERAKQIVAHTPGVEAVLSYVTVTTPLGATVVSREAPVISREVIAEPVPVRTEVELDCCR